MSSLPSSSGEDATIGGKQVAEPRESLRRVLAFIGLGGLSCLETGGQQLGGRRALAFFSQRPLCAP